ncbi:hypothetical protein [Micromonospora rhizosphaerae]|uniref:hypothetical protein n=1 Tax=Micromonospora rhizosphaerae TaxID=568872 RepID=UPI00114C8678|nr:hypothetical protein [Micromonospora rhizosphaerae]
MAVGRDWRTRLVAHNPKSNTMFEAFADYNGPRKPAIKKMNRLSIVDASARVAKISGGSAEGGAVPARDHRSPDHGRAADPLNEDEVARVGKYLPAAGLL